MLVPSPAEYRYALKPAASWMPPAAGRFGGGVGVGWGVGDGDGDLLADALTDGLGEVFAVGWPQAASVSSSARQSPRALITAPES